jgi:hypothetical protein
MREQQILQEAVRLHEVSESLKILAEQNGYLAEGLTILSGTVRNSATLLEVLVRLKPGPERLLNTTSNQRRRFESKDAEGMDRDSRRQDPSL